MIQVSRNGSKSWIMRTTTASGKRREVGLGAYPTVPLAKARDMAAEYVAGRDPRAAIRRGHDKAITFRECAQRYLSENSGAWKNAKHRAQWESTLDKWVYPKLGNLAVQAVDKFIVKDVLMQAVPDTGGKTLWEARHETARRVRQRIETVMGWAKAHDHFDGENPARLADNMATLLPKLSKAAKKVKHHAALPYADAPAFMSDLAGRDGTAAQALQFTILTAARSGEVRLADWSEIDLDGALWTVPEARMKAGREHVVPLSEPALAILKAIPEKDRKGLIWSGTKSGKPMSDMTLAAVLKRMGRTGITVHGFRSTFRDWAGEKTSHERDTIEHALAHSLPDETEAAYARGTQLPKRTRLMAEWAAYLAGDQGADVVPFKAA
jgi:integrase